MANYFYREAIDGADQGVWADQELPQNRAGSIGQLTAQIYEDTGAIKVRPGVIGLDNSSNKGIIVVDTITTVDISGVSNSNWGKVEVSISGTTPSFTAADISGATNPASLPSNFTDAYDSEKGGYYIDATKRCIGLLWKNSGGLLQGVLNVEPFIEGYQGWSTTDDANDFFYRFSERIDTVYDDEYIGRFHLLDEDNRPASWVLNGGTSTSWATVDFSSYVPPRVTALVLKYAIRWDGDGTRDEAIFLLRQNGSSNNDPEQAARMNSAYTNMPNTISNFGHDSQITTLCDSVGRVQYIAYSGWGTLYLNLEGFYLL